MKVATFGKRIAAFGWNVTKIYSFFYVTTNYIIPIDLVVCKGSSMEPVLKNNDVLLTEKTSVRRKHLKQNDIVIATSPINSQVNICKRINKIGGMIGNELDNHVKVPYGYVHLVGDNKKVSKDSNDYGSIPYGLIQSKVLLRIWPLNEIKLFSRSV